MEAVSVATKTLVSCSSMFCDVVMFCLSKSDCMKPSIMSCMLRMPTMLSAAVATSRKRSTVSSSTIVFDTAFAQKIC